MRSLRMCRRTARNIARRTNDASQGLIITNNYVIDHADELTVTLGDGRKLRAKRVGSDPDTDVAIIKVQLNNLTAVESSMKS
jgi:S1-C subfamily serine protease